MDTKFIHWFSGLVDGEGSFGLGNNSRNRIVPQLRFILSLRADDTPVLDMIQRTLGLGKVYSSRKKHINRQGYTSNQMAHYIIFSKAECLRLAELLEAAPLRSKKARDLKIWSEAVRLWNSGPKMGRWSLHDPKVLSTITRMKELVEELKQVRSYQQPKP